MNVTVPARPRHSGGLTVLFLTGMWEIFALAGMRSVLIYYLVKQLDRSEAAAVEIYSFSASAGLILSLVGGVLADRWLGLRAAVIVGAVLMGVGNLALVSAPLLYPALALVAVGSGLLNPALAAQVGVLYAADDPRREGAFLIYKVGCNIGAIVAPLVCGVLGAMYGWNWCFVATAGGMAVAIATFLFGQRLLPDRGSRSEASAAAAAPPFSERSSVIILMVASLGCVLFWAAFKQIETTVALWADKDLDRTLEIFGATVTIPAAWVQAINPILVFALAPILSWWWARRAAAAGVVEDLSKMTLGCVLLAGGFAVLAMAGGASAGKSVALPWLLIAMIPFTLGELYLHPVAQALFTRLAIRGMTALFLSLFNLTIFGAYMLNASAGALWSHSTPSSFFAGISVVALLAAPVLLAARRIATNGAR